MSMPRRFLGYGAYNLCNDKLLAKPNPFEGQNFFEYLSSGGWHVNLVKIILFRRSTQDTLAASRATPLYNTQKAINSEFLTNLQNLVGAAANKGFWVQVCIFHYHAISNDQEYPENLPPELDVASLPSNNCQRIIQWFDPDNQTRLKKQIELVKTVALALKGRGNVLWELANELRVDGPISICDLNTMRSGDCRLVRWLRIMYDNLSFYLSNNGMPPPTPTYITTSTGLNYDTTTDIGNEPIVFSRSRPSFCNTVPQLPAQFFDFHGGQWGKSPDANVYGPGMQNAKARAAAYNPNAFLIINDDGGGARTSTNIKNWATKAFANGMSYASKEPYPPKPYDTTILDAMKQAWESVPIF